MVLLAVPKVLIPTGPERLFRPFLHVEIAAALIDKKGRNSVPLRKKKNQSASVWREELMDRILPGRLKSNRKS